MKRWIIRGIFIGLLGLFVGMWQLAGIYPRHVNWWEPDTLPELDWEKGNAFFFWQSHGVEARLGRPTGFPAGAQGWGINGSYEVHAMGFAFGSGYYHWPTAVHEWRFITFPLWFPAALSVALLWLALLKTRPTVKGQAFPVELEKQSEKP